MNALTNLPLRLYKYLAFTPQNLENLKNQGIYFSSPLNFNDPYDCSITPRIKSPTDDDVESMREIFLADPTVPFSVREQLQRTTTDRLRQMFIKSAEGMAATNVKQFKETRGVSCFSECCDNLLMWAHYGGSYRGFCLEFDTAYFPKVRKVLYSEEMPSFDPVPVLKRDLANDEYMSTFFSKSPSWAYEKEWRVLHAKAGTLYHYPPEVLTGVYFGPEISQAALETICSVVQGQNKGVALWKGSRNSSSFKVDFTRFDYIS